MALMQFEYCQNLHSAFSIANQYTPPSFEPLLVLQVNWFAVLVSAGQAMQGFRQTGPMDRVSLHTKNDELVPPRPPTGLVLSWPPSAC